MVETVKTNHECVIYHGDKGGEILGDVEIISIADAYGYGVIDPTRLLAYLGGADKDYIAYLLQIVNHLEESIPWQLPTVLGRMKSDRVMVVSNDEVINSILTEIRTLDLYLDKYGVLRVLQYARIQNMLEKNEDYHYSSDICDLADDSIVVDVLRLAERVKNYHRVGIDRETLRWDVPSMVKGARIEYGWIGTDLSDVTQPFNEQLSDIDRFVLKMRLPETDTIAYFKKDYRLEKDRVNSILIGGPHFENTYESIVFDPYVSAMFCWKVDSMLRFD